MMSEPPLLVNSKTSNTFMLSFLNLLLPSRELIDISIFYRYTGISPVMRRAAKRSYHSSGSFGKLDSREIGRKALGKRDFYGYQQGDRSCRLNVMLHSLQSCRILPGEIINTTAVGGP